MKSVRAQPLLCRPQNLQEKEVCQSSGVTTDRDADLSRGFGFLEMGSNDDAQKAIMQFNGQELKGRALKVNEANERERGNNGSNHGWTSSYSESID